jgi:hypothetical protein
MDLDTRSAVELYFEGLETGDVSNIPLARDVRFLGPIQSAQGEAEVREMLASVAAGFKKMAAERILVDGEFSCAPFEFQVIDDNIPPITGVDCFRVVEGMIVEIQPFFDPRPLLAD